MLPYQIYDQDKAAISEIDSSYNLFNKNIFFFF